MYRKVIQEYTMAELKVALFSGHGRRFKVWAAQQNGQSVLLTITSMETLEVFDVIVTDHPDPESLISSNYINLGDAMLRGSKCLEIHITPGIIVMKDDRATTRMDGVHYGAYEIHSRLNNRTVYRLISPPKYCLNGSDNHLITLEFPDGDTPPQVIVNESKYASPSELYPLLSELPPVKVGPSLTARMTRIVGFGSDHTENGSKNYVDLLDIGRVRCTRPIRGDVASLQMRMKKGELLFGGVVGKGCVGVISTSTSMEHQQL